MSALVAPASFKGRFFTNAAVRSAYSEGAQRRILRFAEEIVQLAGSLGARSLAVLHPMRFQVEAEFPAGEEVSIDLKKTRQLQKVEWAVKEALRLHPPLFILLREAQEDLELAGYGIKKGTWVAVSPWVAHRDQAHVANSRSFLAQRTATDQRRRTRPWRKASFPLPSRSGLARRPGPMGCFTVLPPRVSQPALCSP